MIYVKKNTKFKYNSINDSDGYRSPYVEILRRIKFAFVTKQVPHLRRPHVTAERNAQQQRHRSL